MNCTVQVDVAVLPVLYEEVLRGRITDGVELCYICTGVVNGTEYNSTVL